MLNQPDIYTVKAVFKAFPPATMYCTAYLVALGMKPYEDTRIMLYGDNLCQNRAASVYLNACTEVFIEKDGKAVLYFDGNNLVKSFD